jgi:hypothetical protein
VPIYHLNDDHLLPLEEITFAQAGIREREHLQQVLRDRIETIAPETLIISEEFGDWDASRRRIDLLGIDKSGAIVVVELKRSQDGSHMELQALRYAAMVSALTFDDAVQIYQRYLSACGDDADARSALLEFLEWEDEQETEFAQDVRIVLASAEFSKEVTTTVLWLNDRGLDIRCVRMRPYRDGSRVLLDIQQVIPLPEAQEYQIGIRYKARKEHAARSRGRDFTKFRVTVGDQVTANLPKRKAVLHVVKALFTANVDMDELAGCTPWRKDLLVAFDGELSRDEFEQALDAQATGQASKVLRYFTAEEELMRRGGKTYALTNQWGRRTEEALEIMLKRFPGHGISVEAE